MKKICLSEQKLRDIVFDAIRKIFNINEGYPDKLDYGKVIVLDTSELFNKYADDIWRMLTISYENHGGLQSYRGKDDFLDRKHLVECVFKNGTELIACATYRKIGVGYKMVSIGCNQTTEGKLALQELVKRCINNVSLNYWCEVSGVMEYYFKKHNGYPIPNIFAHEILGKKDIILSEKDNVHYKRTVAHSSSTFEKMIFGFKTPELYDKVMESVENYYDFREEINRDKTIKEDLSQIFTIQECVDIIERIYTANEDGYLHNLTPSLKHLLETTVNILTTTTEENVYKDDYIEYGNFLLKRLPLVQINEMPKFETSDVFVLNNIKNALE